MVEKRILSEQVVPLLQEHLRVETRRVETGRVQVQVTTEAEAAIARARLRAERVEVKVVPVGREVNEVPPSRQEGDVLIVPVVEEELVVVTRLILKEEVRIWRVTSTEDFEQPVSLRHQRADVRRLPPAAAGSSDLPNQIQQERPPMTTRTITALFRTRPEAEHAKADLESLLQLGSSAVRLHATDTTTSTAQPQANTGILASLRDLVMPQEDRYAYSEGIRRGDIMISAAVDEAMVERALDVLDRDGAVDLDAQEAEWRREGWTGYDASAATAAAPAVTTAGLAPAASGTPATGAGMSARTGDEVIPIVEEQLHVGKREVDRGRVRIRSYVVEVPVEQQVSLREEHVDIERRPVDRPVTAAAAELFRDRTIEATESAEEAVVAKDVRVKEELVIRKAATERVETVRDNVRHTEVEVEDGRVTGTGTTTGTTPTRKPGL